MNVLVIDNYDSFTYNLVQYLGELGSEVEVLRNDVDALLEREPDRVIVSSGVHGPGETITRSGSRSSSASTSLRSTSISDPSSPRYCTRL